MTLAAELSLSIISHESATSGEASVLRVTPGAITCKLADGTGSGKAQLCWSGSGTIANGGYVDLNLQALTDDRGTLNISSVKAICVKNNAASASLLFGCTSAGATPANQWVFSQANTAQAAIDPACCLFRSAAASGMTVSSTSKSIRLASLSGQASYTLVLVGEGAIS